MIQMTTQEIILTLRGMTCGSCTEKIQRRLNRIDGVVSARVNYATECARVLYDPARTSAAKLVEAVRDCGCDVLLEHISIPLHAIGMIAVPQNAIVDARIDWRTRRVDVEWLGIESAPSARPSIRTSLFLLSHLFRPCTSKS
jgi:copper chaperone CopZ